MSDVNSTTDLETADALLAAYATGRRHFANLSLPAATLSGSNLRGADLSYADFSQANLSQANLRGADLSYACLREANLTGALLFFINSRKVLNLEPLQLEANPSPYLCNIALPAYSRQPALNPNRDCDRIPQLLSARYDISLKEAQGIVDEARQHQWD